MATVQVKFRKSTLPAGRESIYYQVAHRGRIQRIRTPIRLTAEEWESARRALTDSAPRSIVQFRIDRDVTELRRLAQRLERSDAEFDVAEVARCFRQPPHEPTILAFMRREIELLQHGRRYGTARNYRRAMNSLAVYLEGEDLPFRALTESLVGEYCANLERRGVVRNTVSFYMRILRSVYNKAVHQHLVEQTYPFRGVYTGVDRTRKRAVDERVIVRLYHLDLHHSASLMRARDYFIFSYCTRGMAFVDMAYLRKTNIRNGTISYVRHKTRQQLSVRIEPVVQQILDRYADPTTPYVFPILRAEDPPRPFCSTRRRSTTTTAS